MFIISVIIIKYYIKSIREITRLDAVSKSPILNYFSEIVKGVIYAKNCMNKNEVFNVISIGKIDIIYIHIYIYIYIYI